MKTWSIAISTASADPASGCMGGRDVEIEVQAEDGRAALIKAISEFSLEPDELFHTVHIGVPS